MKHRRDRTEAGQNGTRQNRTEQNCKEWKTQCKTTEKERAGEKQKKANMNTKQQHRNHIKQANVKDGKEHCTHVNIKANMVTQNE